MFKKTMNPNKDVDLFASIVEEMTDNADADFKRMEERLIENTFGNMKTGDDIKYVVRNGKYRGIISFKEKDGDRYDTVDLIFKGKMRGNYKTFIHSKNVKGKLETNTINKLPNGVTSEIGYIIKLAEDANEN